VGRAGFLHVSEDLVVRQVSFEPRGEPGVVGGLDVLRLGRKRALPQRGGLGGPAEVDQRDGAVVERVG
jgi:hypothetical protein